MTPRTLDLLITTFSYGGNGGIRSAHPDVYHWLIEVVQKAKADTRIGRVGIKDLADTPITMTRNQAVLEARKGNFDLLLMVDSDQSPDFLLKIDPFAKPFWDSSFDFIYEQFDRGPVVVAAPYCGPPPDECVYVFRWRTQESQHPGVDGRLSAFTREEAAERTGIEAVAALPTGLTLWDVRCFEITEPTDEKSHSWFYYEWTDKYEAQKGSTEDVTATRDLSMLGQMKLGYNPVYVNWDAWAGHWKPKNVGKPTLLTADEVSKKYEQAIDNISRDTRVHAVKSRFADEIDWGKLAENNGHATHVNGRAIHPEPETIKPDNDRLPLFYDAKRKLVIAGWETSKEDLAAVKKIAAGVGQRRTVGDIVVAEIGSWWGGSALAIHEGLGTRTHEIHCIDTWDGGRQNDLRAQVANWGGPDVLFDAFRKNMGPLLYDKVVIPHRMTSQEAAEKLDFLFDMVYIDAGHEYDEAYDDILAWLPRVREGGVLCGHDYHSVDFPGVTRAVDELLGSAVISERAVWCVHVTRQIKESVLTGALCNSRAS